MFSDLDKLRTPGEEALLILSLLLFPLENTSATSLDLDICSSAWLLPGIAEYRDRKTYSRLRAARSYL